MEFTDEQWKRIEEATITALRDARSRLIEGKGSLDQPIPTPIPEGVTPTWEIVINYIRAGMASRWVPEQAGNAAIEIAMERHVVGTARYGTPLHPFNGRDHLKDAIAEAADQAVYICNEMELARRTEPIDPGYVSKVAIALQAAVRQFVGLCALFAERESMRRLEGLPHVR